MACSGMLRSLLEDIEVLIPHNSSALELLLANKKVLRALFFVLQKRNVHFNMFLRATLRSRSCSQDKSPGWDLQNSALPITVRLL